MMDRWWATVAAGRRGGGDTVSAADQRRVVEVGRGDKMRAVRRRQEVVVDPVAVAHRRWDGDGAAAEGGMVAAVAGEVDGS